MAQPARLSHAVVIGPSRQVVQGITEEVDVAAFPDRFRQQPRDRMLQSIMIVGDHKLHAPRTALAQPR